MKVDHTVLNILAAATTDGARLVLGGQLDRAMYIKANKVLKAAGGKWDRRAGAHIFPFDAAQAVDQILISGAVTSVRQDYGYFPTPPAVVTRLLELARIVRGMSVLEPSAGQGAIVSSVLDITTHITAYELLEANCDKLVKAVRAHPTRGGMTMVVHEDFLAAAPSPIYDRVVMNPPFAKQADIHHVNHALRFLKPGGLLVSVMAAGVTFRDNRLTQDFRDLVRGRGGDIEALPEGAFKVSGTDVRSVIVTIPAEGATC
jgi:protein-L-isoaspartate O-methyltransferase